MSKPWNPSVSFAWWDYPPPILPLDYVASYTDLMNAFGANSAAGHTHYLQNGESEGRLISFDGLEYIASYADLISALGADGIGGIGYEGATHYIQTGRFEGRTTSFDGLAYIASYGDLIAAFGANESAGATHFIESGRFEGRTVFFDAAQYLANYADLQAAFGSNTEAATVHSITATPKVAPTIRSEKVLSLQPCRRLSSLRSRAGQAPGISGAPWTSLAMVAVGRSQ